MSTSIQRNEFGAVNIVTVIDGCYYDGNRGEFYSNVRPGDKVQVIVTINGAHTSHPSVTFAVRRDENSPALVVKPSLIGWPEDVDPSGMFDRGDDYSERETSGEDITDVPEDESPSHFAPERGSAIL